MILGELFTFYNGSLKKLVLMSEKDCRSIWIGKILGREKVATHRAKLSYSVSYYLPPEISDQIRVSNLQII